MTGPSSLRRSLRWPGALRPVPEDDVLAVVRGSDSKSRRLLGEIAKAFNVDEALVLIWLMESTLSPIQVEDGGLRHHQEAQSESSTETRNAIRETGLKATTTSVLDDCLFHGNAEPMDWSTIPGDDVAHPQGATPLVNIEVIACHW